METASAKVCCFNIGDTKYTCVSRGTKLTGRGVRSEKVRERKTRQLRVCSLFWLRPVTSEELEDQFAHDQACGL